MKPPQRGLFCGNTIMGTLSLQDVGAWFETEAAPLVLYARQWLDPGSAEDVVQETFMRLLQQPLAPRQVKAWLYRVVRNSAWKRVRSRNRRERREDEAANHTPLWCTPDPGAHLDAQEAEISLRTLPADQREIVTLRIWGGLTFEEIAQVLEVSAATALRKHREALHHLRLRMEKPCATEAR